MAFSVSVQRCAAELSGREVTAWELAAQLLSQHPEYGDADRLRSLVEGGGGTRRDVEQWLELVAGVVDAADAEVIDTRATLLALAQLEPELKTAFEAVHVMARLERRPVRGIQIAGQAPEEPPVAIPDPTPAPGVPADLLAS